MRDDLTAAFLAKMAETFRKPFQFAIFYFDEPKYLSDRVVTINGQAYEALVEDWGELSTVGAENAIAETTEAVITLWNGGASPFTDIFTQSDPISVFVDVYQTFDGLAFADAALIGNFVIQDPVDASEASTLANITLHSLNLRYSGQVGDLLTKENYPLALEGDLNKSIDLIIGDAGEVKCLCSVKPATATLTGSFLKLPTKVYAHEDLNELNFTYSGLLQIDDELMYYDSRTLSYFNVTWRGRPIPGGSLTKITDHSDGSEIVQFSTVEYLVGQGPVTSISEVRVKGQLALAADYTTHANQNPAKIKFHKQPTYFEYSKGARTIEEDFDTVISLSAIGTTNCYYPSKSYDATGKTTGAILSRYNIKRNADDTNPALVNHRNLSIKQVDPGVDDGEVIKFFLVVDQWPTNFYKNDYVEVSALIDGTVRNLGRLNRPSKQDVVDFGGDVDLFHSHDHDDGGEHGHDSDDGEYEYKSPKHAHPVDIFEEKAGLPSTYSQEFQKGYQQTSGTTLTISVGGLHGVADSAAAIVRLRVVITGSGYADVSLTTKHGGSIDLGRIEDSRDIDITINDSDGWDVGSAITSNYVKATIYAYGGNVVGGITLVRISDVRFVSKQAVGETDQTEADVEEETGAKVDGEVKAVKSLSGGTAVKIKGLDDVQDTKNSDISGEGSTANSTKNNILVTLRENAGRSVTQRFELSQFMETASWSSIQNLEVYASYKGSDELVYVIITHVRLEIEYRQRQIRTTDEITCKVVNETSINPRPDAVIQYLLTERASVPLAMLGSVKKYDEVWDDTKIWDDTDIWEDDGELSPVPLDAAFEQAGAWFDYNNYRIDGVLSGGLSVEDAIKKLTWQTRSRLLWQNGEAQLVVKRKIEDWVVAKTIGLGDVQLKSYSSKRSPANEIINKIDLFHTLDRLSEAEGPEQYSLSTQKLDQESIDKHGLMVDDELWMFDLIRSDSMAVNIADYYIWILGETRTYFSFNTYLTNFDLEKDDYAQINSYKFARLLNTKVEIVDIMRIFGSGKNKQINLLNVLSQSVRRRNLIVNIPGPDDFEQDTVFVGDALNIDSEFELEFRESVFAESDLRLAPGRSITSETTVIDELGIIAQYKEGIEDTQVVTDELAFHMTHSIDDDVNLTDDIAIAEEPCFGACGFGGPVVDGRCRIPFGSKTQHFESPVDNTLVSDLLVTSQGVGLADTQTVSDTILISDGFGCRIGDGFGLTPFGDKCY